MLALRILPLLDLTSLNDSDTAETAAAVCWKAQTSHGNVAAVCLYPQFVKLAAKALKGTGIGIATVINFPHGGTDANAVAEATKQAVADGATEIDVVLPYEAFLAGDTEMAKAVLGVCKTACGVARLKVILETGALKKPEIIRAASDLAIEAGADFLKTSTGKIPVGATLEAAQTMIQAIKDSGKPVGFKASGGIRDMETAAKYLEIADRIMGPGWATPQTFRFGASSLLDEVLERF